MKRLVLVVVVVASGAVVPLAHAASLKPALRSLQRLEQQAPTTTLKRHAKLARTALRHGRPCVAVAHLNRFIAATRRHKSGDLGARELQTMVLKRAGRRACGLRKPLIRVNRRLAPSRARLAPGRPLARIGQADFVANEVIVSTSDDAALERFVTRWKGHVLETLTRRGAASTYRVRIDASGAGVAGLSDDLRALAPAARGRTDVSSVQGLRLVAVAADAAAHGLTVGLNFLDEDQQFEDRVAAESPTGPGGWNPDPFTWSYFKRGGTQDIGVADAWRALELLGKLGNRVLIGMVDGGFAASGDLPVNTTGMDNMPNNLECGDHACPWHGTSTAMTAAAVADNGAGTAGVAGPIADLRLIQQGSGVFGRIDAIYDALDHGVRIINFSSSMVVPATVSFSLIPFEDATQTAREQGALVFAAAGNKGIDVDAEDCFVACWEEEWVAPCENDGVICVGGLADDSKWRAEKSNYGYEWCEEAPCDVDIFAPWTVWTGVDPDHSEVRKSGGTSHSSPFAAGVAALVWAANPGLSDNDVEWILYHTAHSSPDANVYRYVYAFGAVMHALGGSQAPSVEITAPTNGTHVGYGGLNIVHFAANAFDIEDLDCCTIEWSSGVEGDLGTGPTLDYAFTSPGGRVIKATVHDSNGEIGQATILVVVENSPPVASIVKPIDGAVFYKGAPQKLEGAVSDSNEPLIGCDALKWKIWKVSGFAVATNLTGCQPTKTFTATGDYKVELTATDGEGASAKTTALVHVLEPPPNAPPSVTIDSPDDNQVLDPAKTYALTSTVTEFDEGDPVSLEWTLEYDGIKKVLGTTASLSFKPADHVTGVSTCGSTSIVLKLKATDKDGSSTATVHGDVLWGPC